MDEVLQQRSFPSCKKVGRAAMQAVVCACVNHVQNKRLFLAQTDGIRDLSTLVAAQCGDAHLGHNFPGRLKHAVVLAMPATVRNE